MQNSQMQPAAWEAGILQPMSDFPCEKYEDIDTFDSFVTHQNREKDLEKQQKIGVETYRAEQEEKIRILAFLLENYNDGRKRISFA